MCPTFENYNANFSVDEMQDLFQLNFISIFAACKCALPHLRKTGGNIINMSSWVGANGQAQAPTYAATKGAITAFSKALAIDEASCSVEGRAPVRVNIVSPGNIWTPLWKSWSDGEADPEAARKMLRHDYGSSLNRSPPSSIIYYDTAILGVG